MRAIRDRFLLAEAASAILDVSLVGQRSTGVPRPVRTVAHETPRVKEIDAVRGEYDHGAVAEV